VFAITSARLVEGDVLARGLAILAALCLAAPLPAAAGQSVRVRVATAVERVELAGSDLQVGGAPFPGERLLAQASGDEILWPGASSRDTVAVRARGDLRVGKRIYPGFIWLVPTPGDRMDVINVVPLEDYVTSAVASEIYPHWHAEVLKAQAVVSRTYALHACERQVQRAFDLESSVVSQRYARDEVREPVRRATRETRGEYLAHGGRPILAVFHAAAGGQTADSEEVWGDALPYLRSVSSPDDAAPDYFWSYEMTLSDFLEVMRSAGVRARSGPVEVLNRSRSGRVLSVRVGDARLGGRELRRILGGRGLRSTLFDIREVDGQVRFLGSGSGHGVGLSQWGARELARQGKTYREILSHYYSGAEFKRLGDAETASTQWSEIP
jgi:stage II sporulation protein D